MFQRTATRVGNTTALGPRTPSVAWRVRIDPSNLYINFTAPPVMDAAGRVFAAHHFGVTAVDTHSRSVLWQSQPVDSVSYSPVIYGNRILFGAADDFFYCLDTATGQLVWAKPALPHPNLSPVVDANGVIYYASQTSQGGPLYARRVSDGGLVWSKNINGSVASPALDNIDRVFIGNPDLFDWSAYRTANGAHLWSFIMYSWAGGTSAVQMNTGNARVYMATLGRLYCLDRVTGGLIWEFRGLYITAGQIALGHDETIYVGSSSGPPYSLYAVSPNGEELWQHPFGETMAGAPIVDGSGMIYACTFRSPQTGFVHAVRPDGTLLWTKPMPNTVAASPILAPDGTLYVTCSDKYLYAFRDPKPLGNQDADSEQDSVDAQVVPP